MANSFSYFLVILLLFVFPLHNLAQNNGRIATSSSISATDESTPWLSPSGDFAFGFPKIQENDQSLLCIWYGNIQEKTIVWHANMSDLMPQGSILDPNPQRGMFYLRMFDNRNLVLVTQSVPSNSDYDDEYYNSQTSDSTNVTNSGDKLVFEENGVMHVLKRNNQRQILTPRSIPSALQNYHHVTLNFDDSGWNILWSQPNNICIEIDGDKGTGACGYNDVCNLGTNNRPVCNCPQGYSLVDPNDAYGDCKPDFSIKFFITIRYIDWPKNDFQLIIPSTEQDCQNACLNDCFSAVIIYRSNSCWKKKLPLSNGRIYTNLKAKAFMKIRKDGVPRPSAPGLPNNPGYRQSKNWTVTASTSVLLNVLFISVFCWGFFHIYKKGVKTSRSTSHIADSTCHNFKEEIGRGAFGIVYKGIMPIGSRNVVAIKKLNRVAHEAEKEFITEVNVISQTHHKNLVRLIGYCNEGPHRLLVYEYMKWFRNSQVTVKVYVYSFGVVLLEIITCRKNYENEESYGPEAILTDWVLDYFQERKFEALVGSESEALNDTKQLERFVMVGIWCIQEDPSMRPTMRKICQMLEGFVEVTIPPCPYNF
ncbi:unnamed protein product [Withania somnifera]